jgi:hypothetical protein
MTGQNRLEMLGRRQFLGLLPEPWRRRNSRQAALQAPASFAHRSGDLENRLGVVLVNSG